MFSKNIVTAVLLSILMIFSFTFVSAAEEKPAAETKVSPETAKGRAAAEEKPTGDFTVAAMSRYIWRGYELSRNSIVVQPSATIGYKGFSANIWGNLDTRPYFSGRMLRSPSGSKSTRLSGVRMRLGE